MPKTTNNSNTNFVAISNRNYKSDFSHCIYSRQYVTGELYRYGSRSLYNERETNLDSIYASNLNIISLFGKVRNNEQFRSIHF